MSDKSIQIIYKKEKRTLINKIKKYGLASNGIIFGGLVRDEIIASHYRQEFIDKDLDFKKYYDDEYHPETKGRLLIPNDIDIYFRDYSNIRNFTDDINSYIKMFNGYMNLQEIKNSPNFRSFNYFNSYLRLNHIKVVIEINLGRTLRYSGIRLKLDIDIIYNDMSSITDNINYEKYTNHIEPPFYNLDFLSNIFIMERINNNTNIRISNCTGTPIDTMNFLKKSKKSNEILDDIINFRTQFIRHLTYSIDTEYINCFRIIKMIDREFSWNITNVPFTPIKELIKENCRCCICLEDIKDNDLLISINTIPEMKNVLHKSCFINYLKIEQKKKYRNADNLVEIRCPFRTPFNFKDCYKKVNYT